MTNNKLEMDILWRFGREHSLQSCGAKTRRRTACHKSLLNGKLRCRLHGGLSIGPQTAEGKARIVAVKEGFHIVICFGGTDVLQPVVQIFLQLQV